MTNKKIKEEVKKVKACARKGCEIEALLRQYHLNIGLIRYLVDKSSNKQDSIKRKPKQLLRLFIDEHPGNDAMRSLINKRSLKSVRIWMKSMDLFFKKLKSGDPGNAKELLEKAEKVFVLLIIPANKILAASAR
jgi:hypothetical protein